MNALGRWVGGALTLAVLVCQSRVAWAAEPVVTLKNGAVVAGRIHAEADGLHITAADSGERVIAYRDIHGVSLDGGPLHPVTADVGSSRALNQDWLWVSVVASTLLGTLVVVEQALRAD